MKTSTSGPAADSFASEPAEHEEFAIGDLDEERIEAAFGALPIDTRSETERRLSDTATTSVQTAAPRGMKLFARPTRNRLATFVTEQRWQGYVTDVSEQAFKANVYDVTNSDGDEFEEVEFGRRDVHILMRDMIKPGAIFFWDIGYEIDPGDQHNRKSVISFPMIHRDTTHAVDAARFRARARYEELGWGRIEDTSVEPE